MTDTIDARALAPSPRDLLGGADHVVPSATSAPTEPLLPPPARIPPGSVAFDPYAGTSYDQVIGFSRAMAALKTSDEHPNEDFVFFQTVHLMTEFSWYAMHHEMNQATRLLAEGQYSDAARVVRRASRLQESANGLVATLRDELDQLRFLRLRALLPNGGSGLDSAGMKNLQPAARGVWRAFETELSVWGLELLDVLLTEPGAHDSYAPGPGAGAGSGADNGPGSGRGLVASGAGAGLRESALAFLMLDESVIAWQQAHQRLVWGRLGGHPVVRREGAASEPRLPKSLTGRPVDVLDGFTRRVLFPALWRGVDQVYARTTPSTERVCPARGGGKSPLPRN